MRITTKLAALILGLGSLCAAKCIPFAEASQHLGETTCVAGKVVKVSESRGGSLFLDFCDNYKTCPFTVVVFPSALKAVGDVRQLAGNAIEIHGKIQEWRGRAEIILRDARQLKGEAAKIPPLPKDYDAQKHGNYSAGRFPRKK